MVSWNVLVLLGYDPAAIKDKFQIVTGSGVEYVPRVEVDAVEGLEKRRERFAVLCHTLPSSATVDGVLGLDFFRGWRLVIDFSTGQIDVD